MKRGYFLATIALTVITASALMSHRSEPVQAEIHAEPVVVPYLNKSITEVQHGYTGTATDVTHGNHADTDADREEAGQDIVGAVLQNAGRMEAQQDGNQSGQEAQGADRSDPILTYLGDWTTTAYCPCEICCGEWATGCTASGVRATPDHTVACGILPFGTEIMIDGVIYTVEDLGVDGEWVDIFFDTHDEALQYGIQTKEVYLVSWVY